MNHSGAVGNRPDANRGTSQAPQRSADLPVLVVPTDHRLSATLQRTARLLALSAIAIALLVLAGWVLDEPLLTSLAPDWVSMKPNAAVGVLLCGIALVA